MNSLHVLIVSSRNTFISTRGLILLKHFGRLYICLNFYINCFLVFSLCMRGNVGQKLQNEPQLPHTFVGFNCDANDKRLS